VSKPVSSIGSPFVFPKSEASWRTEFFQKHASAALERWMEHVRSEFITELYRGISKTESPLEAAFVATFMALEDCEPHLIALRAQHAVEVEGRGYRLDFVFEPHQYGSFESLIGPQCPKIALELDGHDFHEKTKEQVTERNRRDRDLQADGWTVLHVSGSEFNADPEKVTREVYQRVWSLLWAAYDAHRKTA
jgi:hypothetical protein